MSAVEDGTWSAGSSWPMRIAEFGYEFLPGAEDLVSLLKPSVLAWRQRRVSLIRLTGARAA